MTMVSHSTEELKKQQDLTDWKQVDAMTDDEIAMSVESDPDARLLDEEDFKKMRWRGTQKTVTKQSATIQVNAGILDFFKARGKGWQSEINHVLQQYVDSHHTV